jgi:hypothetical protein
MVLTYRLHFFIFHLPKVGTKTIAILSIVEGLSFWSFDRLIYGCKLWNEKQNLIQVRNEFPQPTSKLVAELAIKKQGGALIL